MVGNVWSKRKKNKAIAAIAVFLIISGSVVGYFSHRAYAYTTYGTTTATSNFGMSALTNGSDPTTIDAAQSYDLQMNGTTVWELNEYAAPQTGANPPANLGYMFVSQSALPSGGKTSFSGGYGNSQFVQSKLFQYNQYSWTLNSSTAPSESGNDYYALSDVLDMNGMVAPAFNGSTVWPTGGQNLYAPQSSLSLTNIPLPQFSATVSNQYGGASTTTLNTSSTAFINLNVSSFGSNGGGYFGNDYLAAYWVPSGSTSATDALFSPAGNGGGGLSALPSPGQIATNGAMSSISGYPGGFPGQYQTIGDSASALAADSPGLFEIQSPSTAGTYKLVIYLIDGVQRYDAQAIGNLSVKSVAAPAPTLSFSVTPTNAQTTGQPFQLNANTTNAAGGTLTFSQSGTLVNNGGSGTLSGNYQSNVSTISYTQSSSVANYQYQPTADSSQAGTETITASLSVPGQSTITQTVTVTWNAPTCANPIALTQAGNGSGGTAQFTVSDPGGDTVQLTTTGGTLSATTVSSTQQITLTDAAEGADIITATDTSHPACASASLAITWLASSTPSVTCTPNPVKLPTGSYTTITAVGSNMSSTDNLVIIDNKTGMTLATGAPGQNTLTATQTESVAGTYDFTCNVLS